jgi:hypothetical protein
LVRYSGLPTVNTNMDNANPAVALCGECGAPLGPGGTCREYFDSLLALEWQIPGGPGELGHFFAVASYGLQHPSAMGYTVGSRDNLRRAVADTLAGMATVEQLRQRARSDTKASGRVARRDGDADSVWGINSWPVTVADVLNTPAEPGAYQAKVAEWARSILETLDRQVR